MKNLIQRILLIFTLFILASCSNPLDRKYNDITFEADAKDIKESGKLQGDDPEILAGRIIISKLKGEDLSQKTYGEILDEAKSYKKQQEELVENERKKEEDKKKKMEASVILSIISKEHIVTDFTNSILFGYIIKNKTDKNIKALKFHFSTFNSLGEEN